MTGHGRKFTGIAADFADRAAVERLAAPPGGHAVDILVNNAGTIERAPAADHPLDGWDHVLEVEPVQPVRADPAIAPRDARPRARKGDLHGVAAELPGRHQRARLRRGEVRASPD